MKMQKLKKFLATAIAAGMLITAAPGMTEAVQDTAAFDQKLDATYTLALNAINKEDYRKSRPRLFSG